ncbi:TonB-dependent receptor [Erwiniaceae bacterium BAC15a-03b]|uniref:TonB-dependent receptor n=1 Tax=Winslowiella arboricola TaxID=2978220 RepID=A0A9J6PYW0_9GAMM|nr:TonB-dependent receptor [Winslowiella arboricola]MCU5774764.1 TonB-dependent receptor [Winslowiella arboricola]MCU5780084.1 TonB-dependent receptor [Winslowiella arboricola]
MRTFTPHQLLVKTSFLTGVLLTATFNVNLARADEKTNTVSSDQKTPLKITTKRQAETVMTVTAREPEKEAGSKVVYSADDLQKKGANDFGSVMRYETIISAMGVQGGSSAGKSGFDRSGYTGFNIRGLESNRVGIDVDGIPQPDATGRSYVSRAGLNTFGIGRDYLDPYMYGQVEIEAGATSVSRANTSIGGAVSFLPKSADDYLSPSKSTYFGYQSDYDSASHSWHNGITAAAGDEYLRGMLVYSRRDGQQTRNNSDSVSAYPANWHSNALQASAIWQPNDEHKITGIVDYYDKTNHTHYDSWDTSGNTVLGTAEQQSNTRRWGISLKDEWTPYNDFVDSLLSKVFYQHTLAHDNTWMPDGSNGMKRVYSDYNVDTWGFETQLAKTLGRHQLSGGLNGRISETGRPFRQEPVQSIYSTIMQPEADSRSYTLGAFVQDKIQFDLDGHGFNVVPGLRVAHQSTKAQNLSSLTTESAVLTTSDVETLYGETNSDTQLLPSISFNYDLTPKLMTYIQYKRGAQFPNASQLYGSWNLGSNYIPGAQYALIGNPDMKTETSNNFEWGMKGEVTDGVTIRSSLYYNTYKNFIAYSRYSRSANPDHFSNVPSNIATIYQAENRDKAFIYGGDISARLNLGTWFRQAEGLSAGLGFAYSKGESKSSYDGDKYVDLESVAPMKAVVGLAWDAPAKAWGTAVTATFVKGKQATATNRQSYSNSGSAITDSSSEYMRVPGYGMVDMTAYWQATKNVKLSGGLYNITDRKYWDYLSSRDLTSGTAQDANDQALAVMPGRTFQLGVNVDF